MSQLGIERGVIMAVDYKIKEVFKRTKSTLMRFAAKKGVAFQGLSRKINHGKWTVDQLFELAQITGCRFQCCFIFEDGSRLYLHDLEKEGEMIMPTDYNDLLYDKAQNEYNSFLAGLKELPIENAIEMAYEKVFKEDLLICIENGHLEPTEAKALYKQKYPLDYCYVKWRDSDCSYMDMLRDTIDDAAKDAVKEMKAKSRESR